MRLFQGYLYLISFKVQKYAKKARSDDAASLRRIIPTYVSQVLDTLPDFCQTSPTEYLTINRHYRGFHCLEYARLLMPLEYKEAYDLDPEYVVNL